MVGKDTSPDQSSGSEAFNKSDEKTLMKKAGTFRVLTML